MLLQPSARTSFGFKCFAFGIRHGSERSILVEQRMFACECGTSIGYLRKALSKGQVLGASLCVLIERASNGEVTRQQLRPFDWMNIWPELEDTKMLTQPLSRSLIHENQA